MILSFLFFSFYHCLPYWPWACEANRAAKASCGRFNIISLTETSDLFCMWSMKKCEPLCPRHRLTVTTHTETLCPLSVGCRESGAKKKKKSSLLPPQGHCFAYAWWLSFSHFILSLMLSLNILLFFISCSFWFRENHQAYTIESFFFFFLPFPSLSPPSHPLMSLSILHSSPSIAPLDKRGTDAFSDRGGDGIVWNR